MTFYSVKYAWFDNEPAARRFADSHGGEIKKHVYKTGKNIQTPATW